LAPEDHSKREVILKSGSAAIFKLDEANLVPIAIKLFSLTGEDPK
jgi:hypothetical protein